MGSSVAEIPWACPSGHHPWKGTGGLEGSWLTCPCAWVARGLLHVLSCLKVTAEATVPPQVQCHGAPQGSQEQCWLHFPLCSSYPEVKRHSFL